MKINNKVTVLGCGNGGMALAADLKLKGAQVALWSDPNHVSKFNKISNNHGEIILEDNNQSRTVKIDLLSHDFSEAIKFGDVIYNCTPMVAHTSLFKKLTCHLKTGKLKLLINLSGIFSSIEQLLNTNNKNIYKNLKVFDTSSFPYACRAGINNDVAILGRKSDLAIAPLFTKDITYLDLIPAHLQPAEFNRIENSFKLGLMGTNSILHPATMLFNARLIDQGNSFHFYTEGITKTTSLLHEQLDKERLLLAKKMGYNLNTCTEDYSKFYNGNFRSIYDFNLRSPAHSKIQAPTTLNHRFVIEDIGYALTPLMSLGKIYNVKLPNIESVINIFSTIMKINFHQNGRNLNGISKELIHELTQ